MKRPDAPFLALMVAVFFAIVAGGSVPLDAQPLAGPLWGTLLVLLGGGLFVASLCLAHGAKNDVAKIVAGGLFALSMLMVSVDTLSGGDALSLVRVLCSLLVLGALCCHVVSNRVVQTPGIAFSGPLAVFAAAMLIGVLISAFRVPSLDGFQHWMLCIGALFLSVATVGRTQGPRSVLETIVGATSFVAMKGTLEYLAIKSQEPTYRIFADWNNPNALAGILLAAVPLALALAVSSAGLRRTLACAGGGVCLVALLLTQSKGGLLALPVGLFAFLVTALAMKAGRRVLVALVPFAIAGALFFAVQYQPPVARSSSVPATIATAQAQQGAPLQRVVSGGAEAAQSSTYRLLLWRGALSLFKEQPVGYGPGTYRFYSARAGLHEQTQLTHQTFLQFAVEGGALALFAFVFLGVAWTARMFVGGRALSLERNVLRAGVFGSVVAVAANGLLESNLYYLGTGLTFFVLLGVGLQLAADGTSPESLPTGLRWGMVGAMCAVPIALSLVVMNLEFSKVGLVNALKATDRPSASAAAEQLRSQPVLDDEALYLLSLLEPDTQRRIELLNQAVAAGPRTRTLRVLADEQLRFGEGEAALASIKQALWFDPNNLRTLTKKMEIEESLGRKEEVLNTARAIVAVERTPYLQIRALPELVQTEPAAARLVIAQRTQSLPEKAILLKEALDIYIKYRALTVPKIKEFSAAGLDFASETMSSAEKKMQVARDAAAQLEQIYRSSGNASGADEVAGLAKGLALD